jgi:hypothetical protein
MTVGEYCLIENQLSAVAQQHILAASGRTLVWLK